LCTQEQRMIMHIILTKGFPVTTAGECP